MVDFLISAGVIILFLFGVVVYIGYCLDVPHIQRDPLGGGFYITENGRRALRGEPPAPGFFERWAAKKQEKLQAQSQAKLRALEEELNASEEEGDFVYIDEENDPDMKRIHTEVALDYQINLLKRITQEPFAEAIELYGQWQRGAAEDTPPEFWEDFTALKNQFAASGDHYSFIKMHAQETEYQQIKQQVQMLFSPEAIAAQIAAVPACSTPPPLPPLH